MGSDKVVPLLTGLSAEAPLGEKLKDRRGEIFRTELLPGLQPFPKARDLLEALGRRGIERVAATSASADDLKALLERAGVADLMDATVNHDDVDRSKPDPDIVATAVQKARLSPAEVVMVGDTPYDVAAAARAGVAAIAVRSGGWPDDDLRGAVAILDDVAAICARLDEILRARR